MITDLTIKGLRGIKEGSLEGLTPLTLLLGPNGSGKSTILEALYLASSPVPGEAIGQVVTRRVAVADWPQWLLWRCGVEGDSSVSICTGDRASHERVLYVDAAHDPRVLFCRANASSTAVAWMRVLDGSGFEHGRMDRQTRVFAAEPIVSRVSGTGEVEIIDAVGRHDAGLHRLFTAVVKAGRREELEDLMRPVVPGLVDLQILTEGDTPVLHTVFKDRSVPASLAGDGVAALLRLAIELVRRSEGVALVEEPEAHQHPRAIAMSAQVLAEAVKRGVQVIASTHSMEFVDHLLNGLYPDDFDCLSLWRTRLDNGVLRTSRLSGTEVADARQVIEEDLR